MTIARNISNATLLIRASEAKRALNAAERTYKELAALIIERGISGETDISTVTLSKAYDRVDLDTNAVKLDNPDWKDKYGKVTHISPSVRITFR